MSTKIVAELERAAPPAPRINHITPLGPDGLRADKALCGYVWDIPIAGDVVEGVTCPLCYDVLLQRHS